MPAEALLYMMCHTAHHQWSCAGPTYWTLCKRLQLLMLSHPCSVVQAIAAPLGAVVLKLLPARQLEAVVAALMLSLMLLLNRQQLLAWCQGLKQWWLGSSCRHDGGACGWQCKECSEADVR